MIKQINIRRVLFLFLIAGIFFLSNISSAQAEYLYIDDFDDGNILNSLNQAWYVFSYGGATHSPSTFSTAFPDGKFGSEYCARVSFSNVDGPTTNGIGLGTQFVQDPLDVNQTYNLNSFHNGYIYYWAKVIINNGTFKNIDTQLNGGITNPSDPDTPFTTFVNRPYGWPGWTSIATNIWMKFKINITYDTFDGGMPGDFDFPFGGTDTLMATLSNARKIQFQLCESNNNLQGIMYIDDLTFTTYEDDTPPSKVSNMSVNNGPIPGSITFSFPVPASDCYKYVVAYATNTNSLSIATNEANFTVAPNHKTLYAKVETGTETLHLYGLTPGEKYYFRLVACDRAANYSTNISDMESSTATPVTDPVYPALIIDTCEDGDDRNELGTTWYTFDDHDPPNNGNSTITPSPGSFTMTANGYHNSEFGIKYCASYSYTLGAAYQYRFVAMATSIPEIDKNLNNYEGIAFYMKGTGQKSQQIRINSSFNDLLGNYDYFCYTINNTTDEWKWYVLPFTAFKQEGWGTSLNLTSVLSNVKSIVFVPPSQISGEEEQVWYDDIVLLKGDISSLVKTISIFPEKTHLILGEIKTFTVLGKDEDGNDIPVTSNLTWEVVEGDAGTIKNTGEFIAMQYGYARIKVTTGIKDSAGNNLTAYATADVLGDRLFKEKLTIGPNLINTAENPDLYPRIRFYLKANQEKVTLEVFNETGHLIRTIIDKEPVDSGVSGINWDLKDNKGDKVSSGLYIIRISCPVLIKAQKVVIVN